MLEERTVAVDESNFYFDINSREKVRRFYPGVFFTLTFSDGSVVNIPPEYINTSVEGNWFKVNGVKYNIADGIHRITVKYGYFVHGEYDRLRETNQQRGIESRSQIFKDLEQGFTELLYGHPELSNPKISEKGNNFTVYFDYGKFNYEISLNTVNNIVTKNQERRKVDLPFFPFDSNMDKYNTYYMYIRANLINEQYSLFGSTDKEPEIIAADICNEVIYLINRDRDNVYYNNDYKFVPIKSAR